MAPMSVEFFPSSTSFPPSFVFPLVCNPFHSLTFGTRVFPATPITNSPIIFSRQLDVSISATFFRLFETREPLPPKIQSFDPFSDEYCLSAATLLLFPVPPSPMIVPLFKRSLRLGLILVSPCPFLLSPTPLASHCFSLTHAL